MREVIRISFGLIFIVRYIGAFRPSVPTGFVSPGATPLYIHASDELPLEQQSDFSEKVENRDEKVLKTPIAFSYNENEDLKVAASGGGGKHKHGKHASGGGKTHFSDHKSSGGEKGEKGYKGFHDHEKGEKGHHNKEGHKGSYSDEGGKNQKHYGEKKFLGEHHQGEAGDKKSKFKEGGKHEKGHNTKGGHSVNKKDHYEKKHEFFDEYYEDGHKEKEGGYHSKSDYHKGGNKKGGHHKSGHHDSGYGKKGHNEKGSEYKENKGHKKEAGHDEHHSHESKYGKKGGKKGGKKWGYKHGDGGGGGGGGGGKKHGKIVEEQHQNEESKTVNDYKKIDEFQNERNKEDFARESQGHKKETGQDEHHSYDSKYGKEGGKKGGKKWGYKHDDGAGDGGKIVEKQHQNEESKTVNNYKTVDELQNEKNTKDTSAFETLESMVISMEGGKPVLTTTTTTTEEPIVTAPIVKINDEELALDSLATIIKSPVPNYHLVRSARRIQNRNGIPESSKQRDAVQQDNQGNLLTKVVKIVEHGEVQRLANAKNIPSNPPGIFGRCLL